MARPASKALETYGVVHIGRRGQRFRIYWTEGGRQRERSATTLEDARRVALGEAARIGMPGAAVQPATTWGALASSWLAAEHPSWGQRHRDKMRMVLRTHLIPALGSRRASELTPLSFQAVLDDISSRYSSSMAAGALQAMRGVALYGRQMGVWGQAEDPLVGVRCRRPAQDPFQLVAPEEVPTARQVEALARAMVRPEDALLVRFAAGTGLRWGEAIAVRPCDLSLDLRRVRVARQIGEDDGGRLEVRAPKTVKSRRFAPIPRDLIDALTVRVEGLGDDDLVFVSPRGRMLRRSNWNRNSWRPAAARSGWPAELTFHSLRHYAATDWLARGVALEDVSRMLGHTNPRFTHARYVGADADHLDRALAIL